MYVDTYSTKDILPPPLLILIPVGGTPSSAEEFDTCLLLC